MPNQKYIKVKFIVCTGILLTKLHATLSNKNILVVPRYFVNLHLNFGISVVLWIGCFVIWIAMLTENQVMPGTWTDCKLFSFLFYFARHCSSMLLVLMLVEKCFAVYFPLKAKTVCTVKTA